MVEKANKKISEWLLRGETMYQKQKIENIKL